MFWKVIFWIVVVVAGIGCVVSYGNMKYWNLATLLEFVSIALTIGGMYSYAYRKKVLIPLVWKVFFWLSVVGIVAGLSYEFTPLKDAFPTPDFLKSPLDPSGVELLAEVLISIPFLYQFYQIGYNPDKLKLK